MVRLTREQVREVDRRSIDDYHIPGIVLMENAARSFVDAIGDLLPTSDTIAILCGGGNNGGDGFAIARHLHNRGYSSTLVLAVSPIYLRGDALTNWRIVERMGLDVCFTEGNAEQAVSILRESALVLDALFGTGLSRPISEEFVPYVDAGNARGDAQPVVAVDVPSGLDCDTGEPLGPCIRATRTVTFAAEKVGFANPRAWGFLGTVVVGDIGCPRELIADIAGSGAKDAGGLS